MTAALDPNIPRARARPPYHGKHDDTASWDIISNFTFQGLQNTYEKSAPITWHVVSKFMQPGPRKRVSKRINRPKHIVATSVISELVYGRNSWANLLPLCRGISLFAMKAHQSIYRIGSRLGQCTPYSTTRRALILMARAARAYARRRDQRIGRKNEMITGTGATAVQMEDCPPGAFDLKPLLERLEEGHRRNLTVEDIINKIDWDHLDRVSSYHWLNALVFFVPDLAVYQKDVDHLFKEGAKKHQIDENRHTKIHPLGTNSANEVSIHGMKEALVDFFTQEGITEESFDETISFFSGDGKSFDGINKVKRYLSSEPGNFKSLKFIRGVLEIWHTKWTDLSRICHGLWGTDHPNDPSSLGFMAKAIHSPIPADLKKVDFYPNARLMEVAVRAHMLQCWELYLGTQNLPEHFRTLVAEKRLPTLEELLKVAETLAERYSSTEAYENAQRAPPAGEDAADRHPYEVPIGRKAMAVEEDAEDATMDQGLATMIDRILGERTAQVAQTPPIPTALFKGDWALANSIMLMRDGIWFLEVCQAVASGDIGRVWEIMKIWICTFAGSGHPNYANYLLEMFCNIELEYPEATRTALLNNWLVNLVGRPGHFHELDLMQEHFNHWLEELAQHKGKEFDDEWYREVLSMHVHNFLRIKGEMENLVQIAPRTKTHTEPHLLNEYAVAMRICREHRLHIHIPGRDFGFHSDDAMSSGIAVLARTGKLDNYITDTIRDQMGLQEVLAMPDGAADASTYMHPPMHYVNGQLQIPEALQNVIP
ncbi:hypothetical protein BV25DRAFT_1936598 [Artomyces pyxidatus]|uniref:Uncharacterized protein n=1 Tax=Artomyces pyxidatus TaxID=48021 RepID=A0ACB8T586_9AGAM|nr:hypothetical protein BV25DRAFT_1936598 [Artomyces pyxidatus]